MNEELILLLVLGIAALVILIKFWKFALSVGAIGIVIIIFICAQDEGACPFTNSKVAEVLGSIVDTIDPPPPEGDLAVECHVSPRVVTPRTCPGSVTVLAVTNVKVGGKPVQGAIVETNTNCNPEYGYTDHFGNFKCTLTTHDMCSDIDGGCWRGKLIDSFLASIKVPLNIAASNSGHVLPLVTITCEWSVNCDL